jgi:hypothetical protein
MNPALKHLSSIRDTEEYIVTQRSYIEELEKMLRADMEENKTAQKDILA